MVINHSKSGIGLRPDGTRKGPGFMGALQRPDGGVSTELSIGVEWDGQEHLIPALVPTLTPEERGSLLAGNDPTDEIVQKAVRHAQSRMAKGKSPFQEKADAAQTPTTNKTDFARPLSYEKKESNMAAYRGLQRAPAGSEALRIEEGRPIRKFTNDPRRGEDWERIDQQPDYISSAQQERGISDLEPYGFKVDDPMEFNPEIAARESIKKDLPELYKQAFGANVNVNQLSEWQQSEFQKKLNELYKRRLNGARNDQRLAMLRSKKSDTPPWGYKAEYTALKDRTKQLAEMLQTNEIQLDPAKSALVKAKITEIEKRMADLRRPYGGDFGVPGGALELPRPEDTTESKESETEDKESVLSRIGKAIKEVAAGIAYEHGGGIKKNQPKNTQPLTVPGVDAPLSDKEKAEAENAATQSNGDLVAFLNALQIGPDNWIALGRMAKYIGGPIWESYLKLYNDSMAQPNADKDYTVGGPLQKMPKYVPARKNPSRAPTIYGSAPRG